MKNNLFGIGIFIPVSNLDRSTEWYKNILGFEVVHNDEPEAVVLKMGDGTVRFCLVKCTDIKPLEFPKNNYEVDGYYNFHTNNVEEIHRVLSEKGANISEIHQLGDNMRGFQLIDPEGNRFGVIQ